MLDCESMQAEVLLDDGLQGGERLYGQLEAALEHSELEALYAAVLAQEVHLESLLEQ